MTDSASSWSAAIVTAFTEAFPLTTLQVGSDAPPGSSGKRNEEDFDVRIFDDADRELAPGEVGQVVCRPRKPNVPGLLENDRRNLSVMSNLWFHTGDLGKFDDGFFLLLTDKRTTSVVEARTSPARRWSHIHVPLQPSPVASTRSLSEFTEDDLKVTAVLVPESRLTPAELFEWSRDNVLITR